METKASMSKKNTTSAKNARERMRAERERQAAAQKRRDRMLQLGIAIVVVVVLVGVGGLVVWQRGQQGGAAPNDVAKIADGKADTGAGGLGDPISGPGEDDAPVLVEIYEDFLCPHCGSFERSAGDYMKEQADAGKIKVVYYPVTLEMFEEPTKLAANAYVCAVNKDPDKAQDYHAALYEQQQQWSNDQLIEVAKQTGITSQGFSSCVNNSEYKGYLDSMNKAMTERGESGTPAVFVNDKKIEGPAGGELGVAELQTAVNEATKS